jgi:hypothetical protein
MPVLEFTLRLKKERLVKIVGVLLVFVGWLLPILTLGIAQSTGSRMFLSLLGIAISLVGILGVLNKIHLKTAIWKV